MSLYELTSTFQALGRRQKKTPVAATPEQMAATKDQLARMTAGDPSVRLH